MIEPWDPFASKLQKTAARFLPAFGAHNPMVAPDDPKTWAMLLLARTASCFDVVRLLLAHNCIVQARTITRCCDENLFWLSALAKRGAAFVKEMHADNQHWTLKQAGRILEWTKTQERTFEFTDPLKIAREEAEGRKTFPINHYRAAQQGGIAIAYTSYAELSADAAHPSVTSLSRHLTWPPHRDDCTFHIHAPATPAEVSQTLGMACGALLSVMISTDELLEHIMQDELGPLIREHASFPPEAFGDTSST